MQDEFVRPEVARRMLKVSDLALRNWTDKGRLESIKTAGGHRRYSLKSIKECDYKPRLVKAEYTVSVQLKPKENICYARVSGSGQKEDLERQINLLREKYPNYRIIKDVGSGLNFKRKGFSTILDTAIKGNIGNIVVTHKDRLCRFGFELIEKLVNEYSSGKIVVLNRTETSPQEELVNDLISIITVFSARVYGLRSHTVKKAIKKATRAPTNKDIESSTISS